MKLWKSIGILFLSTLCLADTTTTRMGLVVPTAGSTGWAPKLNNDLSVIDSSAAVLGQANAFTGTNSFSGTMVFPNLTANQCLTLDGSNQVTSQSCVTPPGSDTQVIYNQGGTFAGDSDFTFNGTTASITGIVASSMTVRRIVWPDGTVQVSSPTTATGPAGAAGSSVYPATATASFPYGATFSTVTVSTIAVNAVTNSAGTAILTTTPGSYLFISSITFADNTVLTSTSGIASSGMTSGATYYIQNTSSLQTGSTFYTSSGTVTNLTVPQNLTVGANLLLKSSSPLYFYNGTNSLVSSMNNPSNRSLYITAADGVGINQSAVSGNDLVVSTVTVSSMTVRTAIRWPDGTIQVSSPTAGGSSTNLLPSSNTWTGTNVYTSTVGVTVNQSGSGFALSPYNIKIDQSGGSPTSGVLFTKNGSETADDAVYMFRTDSVYPASLGNIYGLEFDAPIFGIATYPFASISNNGSSGSGLIWSDRIWASTGFTSSSYTFTGGTASRFVKTDANKNLSTVDLYATTNTWTGQQTWSSPRPSTFTYQVNVGSITGAGLATCGDSTHGLAYSGTTGLFSCQSITGGGGGGSSTSGQVNTANQNYMPYYSVSGSSNVLSGTTTILMDGAGGFSSPSATISNITSTGTIIFNNFPNSNSDIAISNSNNGSIAIGKSAGGSLVSNVAVGYSALLATLVSSNTAVGNYSGVQNTTGTYSSFFGDEAGQGNFDGRSDSFPTSYRYGSSCTFVGARTGVVYGNAVTPGIDLTYNNSTAIGFGATIASSNTIVMGGTGVNAATVIMSTFSAPNGKGVAISTNVFFTPTTNGIIGTTTNDNTILGNVGESSATISATISCAAANTYTDVGLVTLTAGDWDIDAMIEFTNNGASAFDPARGGIGTTSGNSSAGLLFGNTAFEIAGPTSGHDSTGVIPPVRKSISATTTYYLKAFCGNYATATPQVTGRMSARRVR